MRHWKLAPVHIFREGLSAERRRALSRRVMSRRANAALLIPLAALGACAGTPDTPSRAVEIAPIGTVDVSEVQFPGASTPNLVVAPNGAVHLTFSERVDSTTSALRFATWENGFWRAPRDIARGLDFFVNWADFSSMAVLENGDLAAHWLEREGKGTYAYGVRIARSRDGGETWETARTPHADGLLAEHGFVALWPVGNDAVGAVWLDGRKTAMKDSAREMTLRTATIGRETAAIPEVLLDARVCDCCQTSSARARSGRVIVYRDRTENEVRDIAIVREQNGAWSEPAIVHNDNWVFDACPVNGPSVAAIGDTVVVAWFTGAQDTARVRVATSIDGGQSFGAPVRIDDGDPLGRVTVLLDDDALPIVLWMERVTADSAAVRVRRVGRDGSLSAATTVSAGAGSRRSGFPRMVRSGDALLFAWTVPGDSVRVRVGRAALQP